MRILVSIMLQALFVALALATTLLRCWVRIGVEKRSLTLPDYLVWCGWLCTLGWFICSVVALRIQIEHPLVQPDLTTNSVNYLVTVFVASYLFDIGLYFPKAALIAFYWWLISPAFRRLRIALRVGTAYLACAFVASLLVDTLICLPISHNWSIENQLSSLWNTYAALAINWALNWSTDLLLFILPFFMLNFLTLTKRQKIALCGVFSLGLFTIIISLARFLVYTLSEYYSLDDASGNLWCTAEICIATIVVSLPTLKVLVTRPRMLNALNRERDKELNSSSDKHADTFGSRSSNRKSWGHIDTFRSHVQAEPRDDEIELVAQRSRRSSRSPTRTASAKVEKNAVRITTDVTISRDRLSSIS